MMFQGEQEQVPPMYSALKHNGERLYKLARRGEEVERASRDIRVDDIELLDFRVDDATHVVEIDVCLSVSKGTYIRRIAADLGEKLAVGGFVSALRRVQSGPFVESQAVDFEQLERLKDFDNTAALDELLLPMDSALQHIPSVVLDPSIGFYIQRGQAVQVPDSPLNGKVRLLMEAFDFIGIGEIAEQGRVAPKRLVVA